MCGIISSVKNDFMDQKFHTGKFVFLSEAKRWPGPLVACKKTVCNNTCSAAAQLIVHFLISRSLKACL